jgi:hypothetical protein
MRVSNQCLTISTSQPPPIPFQSTPNRYTKNLFANFENVWLDWQIGYEKSLPLHVSLYRTETVPPDSRTRTQNVFTSSSFRGGNFFIWVYKFVCVCQSLKIKKWTNQMALLYRRSRHCQYRPRGSVLFAGQSAITNFHLSARPDN